MDEEHREAAARHPSNLGPRSGEPDSRGVTPVIGVNLPNLAAHSEFAPAVEYLTAIQSMRGEGDSLLFVRGADIDALAEQDGRPVPEFLDRLDQLGIVVSSN